ncbi:MAG TPA: hypothetical protein V6C57_07515 [Coleofasciculaceae cyanobacterium]
MPIKNETDRHLRNESYHPRLRVVCTMHKGAPKQGNNAGQDLRDCFRFETKVPELASYFKREYGDRPKEIRLYLPYEDVEQNFPTWMESWSASGFKHRCDRETICEKMVETKVGDKCYWRRQDVQEPCPYVNAPECPTCRRTGRLFFHIREFYHAGFTQACMMTITGAHDVIDLTEELARYQQQYCNNLSASPFPSAQTLGFIPWVMRRVEKTIFRPILERGKQTGGRAKGSAWVVSLAPDPEWLAGLMRHSERMALLEERKESIAFLQPVDQQALPPSTPQIPSIAPSYDSLDRTPAWQKFEELLRVAENEGAIARARDWILKVNSGQFRQVSVFEGYEMAVMYAVKEALDRFAPVHEVEAEVEFDEIDESFELEAEEVAF